MLEYYHSNVLSQADNIYNWVVLSERAGRQAGSSPQACGSLGWEEVTSAIGWRILKLSMCFPFFF